MGILTNFLKLLKPDENDYYNAITEQAENWQKVDNWAKGIDGSNKNKLDKGNVSAEYDTAKKIEDKIKEVKNATDGKVSKSGDTMTGNLTVPRCIVNTPNMSTNNPQFQLMNNNEIIGFLGGTDNGILLANKKINKKIELDNRGSVVFNTGSIYLNSDSSRTYDIRIERNSVRKVEFGYAEHNEQGRAFIYNATSLKGLELYDDGTTKIPANNLTTPEKDVVDAINGLNSKSLMSKSRLRNLTPEQFNTITEQGIYMLDNCEIAKGVYKWGTLIVTHVGDAILQEYHSDYTGQQIYVRSSFNNADTWRNWVIVAGRWVYASTLQTKEASFSLADKEIYKLAIDLRADKSLNTIHGYYEFDNVNLFEYDGIKPFNNYATQDPTYVGYEVYLRFDKATKSIILESRGNGGDAIANIYIM